MLPPLTPDSAAWADFPVAILSESVTGARPRQSTTLRLAWNEEALRIFFEIEDDHIAATMTRRDSPLYQEEVVEIFLDPVGDAIAYFEIEVNPLNAVLDLVLRQSRSGYLKDFNWKCEGLESRAARVTGGWLAWCSIPFASLGSIRPQAGDHWRANFCRIDRPAEGPRELSAWSPTGLGTFHVPQRFGWIDFTV